MIKTYGLTHIALSVKDLELSSRFYETLFGCRRMYVSEDFIQLQTPGSHDIIVLEKSEDTSANTGGIKHFGFRLIEKNDIKNLIREIEKAGGIVKESGEFCPGEPYVFFYDPDGYEIEVWYELPVGGFK